MKEEKNSISLKLVSVEKRELYLGISLIGLSFLMPLFFNVHNFQVRQSIVYALQRMEQIALIGAAARLVALNSLRGVPHYVGAYFVGESLSFSWRGRRAWPLSAAIIPVILLMTYRGIEILHGIRYDFGIPAVLVCFFVLLFRKAHYRYISLWKKASMIGLVLIAFQFLDIMPLVDAFPIGRGETSKDLKLAAAILSADSVLNAVGLVGIVLFLAFALLIFSLLREENSLKELAFLREQNQAILMQSQLSEMKSRTYQELQYLVHDLKSPLTTVQTLVGVLKMESEAEQRRQDVEYLDYVENAVERMSEMISEMLYYDQNNIYTTQTLVDAALAQCSVKEYANYLRVDNRIPDVLVSANRLMFTRSLINLMENSAQAMTHQKDPEILLRVDRNEKGGVVFAVEDNGDGIDAEELDQIWNHGTSGRHSSGLGLAFVQTALQRMNGEICFRSKVGEGTCICLILPEETGEE
ncbi:MAG: hypothetical protein IJE22_00480 [Oscillibacter sp.]|nr:hypothetical protein [Oscillibacter sp.]